MQFNSIARKVTETVVPMNTSFAIFPSSLSSHKTDPNPCTEQLDGKATENLLLPLGSGLPAVNLDNGRRTDVMWDEI